MAKPIYPLTPRATYYLRDLKDGDRFQLIGDRKRRLYQVITANDFSSYVISDDGSMAHTKSGALPVKFLRSANEKS